MVAASALSRHHVRLATERKTVSQQRIHLDFALKSLNSLKTSQGESSTLPFVMNNPFVFPKNPVHAKNESRPRSANRTRSSGVNAFDNDDFLENRSLGGNPRLFQPSHRSHSPKPFQISTKNLFTRL